ncbi:MULTISPECIES: LON peptidase substrate-binding domain-containing protein [unclassified Sphingomonas]|jgi:Lon protease-like protein|uniref:LON peptidase substrate-binding domain-containing protein n=1 Tax=unclassified Sphingomonas TaxID=196159 RepID=UPI00226A932D|nr:MULTISPECIES: LON peptidase substrate-binding domain-containing protein [unclassified Sphingomonas]
MTQDARQTTRLSVFPLPGALLFPGMHLPLHIFEPRYRAMVSDAMARDRRIGMIQPRLQGAPPEPGANGTAGDDRPELYDIGCVGRIAEVEALEDGRFNLVLEGVALFRIVRELDVTTAFRQVEAELLPVTGDETLSLGHRSSLELESRRYAEAQGYTVDWDAVERLDDESLVNGIAQIAPFDAAAKQALLEAPDIETRAELIIQLMQFFGRHDGEDKVTLQ